ncbi:hypothetical protein [Kutzneria sp. NPDC052558]|uniref:hypothetical protein n=1 Tax=Kutzneria sp. NPDC052558 TaxID=3364121 RepID=UPI0037C75616
MRRLLTVAVAAAAIAGGSVAVAHAAAPPDFAPANASWLSANEGFVLGLAGCDQPTLCTTLLHTTDGARSWTPVPVPETDLPDNQYRSFPTVVAATAKRLLVWDNNRILETVDAGKHWSTLAVNSPAPSLMITDVRYFKGRVYAMAGSPEQVDLYAAGQDGLDPVPGVTMHRGVSDVQATIAGGDALEVSLTNAAQQWPTSTWRSTDGKTFTQQIYPCYAGEAPIYAEHKPGAPIAAICAGTQPVYPGNWDKAMVLAPPTGGKVTRAPQAPEIGVVAGFALVTDKVAVMPVSGGGVTFMMRTEDAGQTWTNTFTIDGQVWSPDLAFVNGATAYQTVEGTLWRSTDVGRTWQPVDFGGTHGA